MTAFSASNSADHTSQSTILLTGATGLVGQYLMRDLLMKGHSVAVIARASRRQTARERIDSIMQRWETEHQCQIARPTVLEGNVAEPGFGLAPKWADWVQEHCDRLIHNAAILQFEGANRQAEPWKTNLGGTRNALELASQSDIGELHYVSTAYVCGKQEGPIMEDALDDSCGFRNDYERSKFQAEKLVRDSQDFENVTIYRPAVISGDSRTGFTSTYHGLYVYLRLFALFIPELPRDENGKILTDVRIPMEGNEPRNIVPVDWVSRVFCEIFGNRSAHGKTYHLAPDHCVTPSQVVDACYSYFNSHGAQFCGTGLAEEHDNPEFAARIFENVEIYQKYEANDPVFDTTNLRQFTSHLPCPPIDAETIHRYLEFGEQDQWGKRKPARKPTPVPADAMA